MGIDTRVANLYNLTEEEYSLILSELKATDPFCLAIKGGGLGL